MSATGHPLSNPSVVPNSEDDVPTIDVVPATPLPDITVHDAQDAQDASDNLAGLPSAPMRVCEPEPKASAATTPRAKPKPQPQPGRQQTLTITVPPAALAVSPYSDVEHPVSLPVQHASPEEQMKDARAQLESVGRRLARALQERNASDTGRVE